MHTEYATTTQRDGGWWIGWVDDVPGVKCQERTYDELVESLRITLREALDLEQTARRGGGNP